MMANPHAPCCTRRANQYEDYEPTTGRYRKCMICGHYEFRGVIIREPTEADKYATRTKGKQS